MEHDPCDSALDACLARTRKGVLNVLSVMGLMIAASGWLIRYRAKGGIDPAPRALHDGLFLALMASATASYVMRRPRRGRSSGESPSGFYRTHVGAAAVAAIGVPLGLAYGWFVEPTLQGVAPFWVVPMALGSLAWPRRAELEGIELPSPPPEATDS